MISSTENSYQFAVKAEENPTKFAVSNILLTHYHIGDHVQLTAPMLKNAQVVAQKPQQIERLSA